MKNNINKATIKTSVIVPLSKGQKTQKGKQIKPNKINSQKAFDTFYNLPEFTISLKQKHSPEKLFQISTPRDAAYAARFCFQADDIDWKESFIVIALNRANNVMGFYKVSTGGVTSTVADPRVILQFALLSNACNLILAHNHPSRNSKPSYADEILTDKIKTAASYLDITVLDHIIVTANECYSMEGEKFVTIDHSLDKSITQLFSNAKAGNLRTEPAIK
jgi:DNA repair protein RadC